MPITPAQLLPQAAADAIDALEHLTMFAMASGHECFAKAALASIENVINASDARQIVPARYFSRAGAEPAVDG